MLRRPLWLGAGVVLGVGGTLWAEQRVRRRVRRAVEALSPRVAGSEAVQAAREMGDTVRDALDVARAERRRREAELWRRLGSAGADPAPARRERAGPAAQPAASGTSRWGARARGTPRRRR
jgi:hypothetical protein